MTYLVCCWTRSRRVATQPVLHGDDPPGLARLRSGYSAIANPEPIAQATRRAPILGNCDQLLQTAAETSERKHLHRARLHATHAADIQQQRVRSQIEMRGYGVVMSLEDNWSTALFDQVGYKTLARAAAVENSYPLRPHPPVSSNDPVG